MIRQGSRQMSNLINHETETSEEPGSQLLDCKSSDQAWRRANHVLQFQAPRTSAWLRENLMIGEMATAYCPNNRTMLFDVPRGC